MKPLFTYLLLLLTLLFALPAEAQFVTATITITNIPADGNTFVPNSTTLTWKNTVTTPASQILIGADTNAVTTNLWQQLIANPANLPGVIITLVTNNVITLQGPTVTATLSGTWGSIVITSVPTTNGDIPIFPVTSLSPAAALAQMNNVVAGLEVAATASTATAPYLANYLGLSTAQTVSGAKFFTGANVISNANNFITGGGISNMALTNITFLKGSNGIYWALILVNPVMTNGQNFGNPFRSPGTGPGAEQFGTSAFAFGNATLAVGNQAYASNNNSTAVGNQSSATASSTAIGSLAAAAGNNSTAIGNATSQANGSIAIGFSANAEQPFSLALGQASDAQGDSSAAIGVSAVATVAHEITLGTSTEFVLMPGNSQTVGGTTNIHAIGTNTVDGDIAFLRKNITLVNSNNVVSVSTNLYIKVTGPTGPFCVASMIAAGGNHDGCIRILQNSTGFTMVVANESGFDGTAANHIYTGSNADVAITNNPGWVQLMYDSSVSRWCVQFKSN